MNDDMTSGDRHESFIDASPFSHWMSDISFVQICCACLILVYFFSWGRFVHFDYHEFFRYSSEVLLKKNRKITGSLSFDCFMLLIILISGGYT